MTDKQITLTETELEWLTTVATKAHTGDHIPFGLQNKGDTIISKLATATEPPDDQICWRCYQPLNC